MSLADCAVFEAENNQDLWRTAQKPAVFGLLLDTFKAGAQRLIYMRYRLPDELDKELTQYAPYLEYRVGEGFVMKKGVSPEIVEGYDKTIKKVREFNAAFSPEKYGVMQHVERERTDD